MIAMYFVIQAPIYHVHDGIIPNVQFEKHSVVLFLVFCRPLSCRFRMTTRNTCSEVRKWSYMNAFEWLIKRSKVHSWLQISMLPFLLRIPDRACKKCPLAKAWFTVLTSQNSTITSQMPRTRATSEEARFGYKQNNAQRMQKTRLWGGDARKWWFKIDISTVAGAC